MFPGFSYVHYIGYLERELFLSWHNNALEHSGKRLVIRIDRLNNIPGEHSQCDQYHRFGYGLWLHVKRAGLNSSNTNFRGNNGSDPSLWDVAIAAWSPLTQNVGQRRNNASQWARLEEIFDCELRLP
jgi:hypothetical protein